MVLDILLLRRARDIWIVIAVALCARLLFLVLTSDTYDFDEFVLLQFGRDVAHGSRPYSSFHFFHPPGAIELYAALTVVTDHWWPIARILQTFLDTGTAVLMYVCGSRLWTRRVGMYAGLLYALNPLALVSAVRVGQDPIITFLGVLGLTVLLHTRGQRGALSAGAVLGVALWFKYPALYFLPAYALLAPRRLFATVMAAAGIFVVLLVPFHHDFSGLYADTIQFQKSRWHMDFGIRLRTTLIFWLGINVPALLGLAVTGAKPRWLAAGYVLGGCFVLTSQVYYHYFVPVVPFAALLGAPALARWGNRGRQLALYAGLATVPAWGLWLAHGGASPLYVTAAHLSDIQPTVRVLDRITRPDGTILADRFEYAYLARRPALVSYFWNVGVLINAQAVERMVPLARTVVLSYGASSNYPTGFTTYMDRHFRALQTRSNRLWLIPLIRRSGVGRSTDTRVR